MTTDQHNSPFGCDEHTGEEWCRCILYVAPQSGYYSYVTMTKMFKQTGQFQSVPNTARRWFEFWKPKCIDEEIIREINEPTGRALGFFHKGETILTCGVDPELVESGIEFE